MSDWYFGKDEFDKYAVSVIKELKGQKVSKRKDLADKPNGVKYEASRLGMQWTELICCLAAMCYNGLADEIDDSTYFVFA